MTKHFFIIVAFFVIACAPSPLRINAPTGKKSLDLSALPRLDPVALPRPIMITSHNGTREYKWTAVSAIDLPAPCRIPYQKPSLFRSNNLCITGRLPNGISYPVVLDTGNHFPLAFNTTHVTGNKLPVYPFDSPSSGTSGLCYIPQFHLGSATLHQVLPVYFRPVQLTLWGIPLKSDSTINIGLPVLRNFSYISFDGRNRNVELSYRNRFAPKSASSWIKYPFTLETSVRGVTRLVVEVPIAGHLRKFMFDTGLSLDTACVLSNDAWLEIHTLFPAVTPTDDILFFPYGDGLLACRSFTPSQSFLGDSFTTGGKIKIMPSSNSSTEGFFGILGIQPFFNRTIVLDFTTNSLWVRIPEQ